MARKNFARKIFKGLSAFRCTTNTNGTSNGWESKFKIEEFCKFMINFKVEQLTRCCEFFVKRKRCFRCLIYADSSLDELKSARFQLLFGWAEKGLEERLLNLLKDNYRVVASSHPCSILSQNFRLISSCNFDPLTTCDKFKLGFTAMIVSCIKLNPLIVLLILVGLRLSKREQDISSMIPVFVNGYDKI